MMYLKITGKNETLEELNKAKKMIEEASKILHHLQFAIGVELVDDTEAEKQMTLAEAEVFPEYLERTIKKNSELNEKAKRFTVNENLFYSSNKSQNS